jgi:hypothetical protein
MFEFPHIDDPLLSVATNNAHDRNEAHVTQPEGLGRVPMNIIN